MSQEQKLLPVEEAPPLLLDRPAEERLKEELERERAHTDGQPGKPQPKQEEEVPHPSKKGLVIALLVGLVLLAIIFLAGYLPRRNRTQTTQREASAEEYAIPVVNVTQVKRSPSISRLLLPGNITPLIEAPIYARASGYVVKRLVDIGDRVRTGQLLAVIDAPDLDQQVAQGRAALSQARQQYTQAEATLEQSKAQLALARVTWQRYDQLVTRGAVARQDADTQKTNYDTAQAVVNSNQANVAAASDNVKAAQANLDRLLALQSYKDVRAPFSGVITQRNIDIGTYVSTTGGQSGQTIYSQTQNLNSGASSSSGSSNGALYTIAQNDRLRILIEVPQADAPAVHVGLPADALVAEYNGRRFAGKVTRTSNELDPSTRELLTEVQVANPGGVLLPGMYAEVQFASARATPPLIVPGDAVLTRTNGLYVAVLRDPDEAKLNEVKQDEKKGEQHYREEPKQVHLERIDVGRDYGVDTEVTSGLQGWEYIVTNPNDAVYEGALVLPRLASGPSAAAPGGGGATSEHPSSSGQDTSAGGAPGRGGSGQQKSSGSGGGAGSQSGHQGAGQSAR